MLRTVQNYHRPKDLVAAGSLLRRPDVETVLIAGGTGWVPHAGLAQEEIVDLQDLGLDLLETRDGSLFAGAMVRLQDLMDFEETPDLVRDMCAHAGPNTIRNMATIGGVLAAGGGNSELLAALLVFEAGVQLDTAQGPVDLPLDEFLKDRGGYLEGSIITSVSLPRSGRSASARVARTPMDQPIVAALGRRTSGGRLLTALCGMGPVPVLTGPEDLDRLHPPDDFLGSARYRRRMAEVLLARVQRELED